MKLTIEACQEKFSKAEIQAILDGQVHLELSADTIQRINKCHQYLQDKIRHTDQLMYGINTGFGSLCNVGIPDEDIEKLQVNLIRSHACGAGDKVPRYIGRLILFLKIRSLSYGHSAVSAELVLRLTAMFNDDYIPVMYEQGSLGASGDLAPLAHLALPLMGEGELYDEYGIIPAAQYLDKTNQLPYHLKAKEGLALINGTQFSLAYLQAAHLMTSNLETVARYTAAMSLEGFDCSMAPFDPDIHRIRPGNGQPEIATAIRQILEGSAHMETPKEHVQDPYSFRCIPQVHGASWKSLQYLEDVITAERNSVTDNPNVFPDSDKIVSGGNFHAQPLALGSDYLCMAAAELGSISERRTYLLISGQRGLTAFLTTRPGLESGFMIAQYTAASIVSQNKQLATPASVDSIVSSNGQEDHVSMAANAGVKALKVANNLATILAIEWQIATQAVEMKQYAISPALQDRLREYRTYVPVLLEDRILQPDFVATKQYFKDINYFQ